MIIPNEEHENETQTLCDFCNESKALLYCRADSAKLCFTCDREVHSTNPLFKKHTRCLLCNSCNSSPASIFCCTDSTVLCQNCDWETHNSFKSVHDRRPVEGFNGCPMVGELLGILGFEDLGKKNLDLSGENDEEYLDYLVWETPVVVGWDDLIVPNDCHNFQAMGVPPLPKNRNAVCGKHKEEILGQLHEMAKTEPGFTGSLDDFKPLVGFQSQEHGEEYQLSKISAGFENNAESLPVSSYETNALKWYEFTDTVSVQGVLSSLDSFIDLNHIITDNKHSDIGDGLGIANGVQELQSCEPVDSKALQVIPEAGRRELNSQERDSALSRYKEKKKTRRYDKHVRYESRKVRAESRIRIKGRFAKIDR